MFAMAGGSPLAAMAATAATAVALLVVLGIYLFVDQSSPDSSSDETFSERALSSSLNLDPKTVQEKLPVEGIYAIDDKQQPLIDAVDAQTSLDVKCEQSLSDGKWSCIDPVGLDGEWVKVSGQDRMFDSPECCGPGPEACPNFVSRGKRWGTTLLLKSGIVLDTSLYKGDPAHPAPLGGYACECADFNDEYKWQSPLLEPFDASRTCRMLGDRTVLMIGDSLGQQVASTLMNSFRPSGETCQSQFAYASSDTLVGVEHGNLNRGKRWTEYVEQFKPDIVVVNVGGHILDNDAIYLEIIDQVISEMEEVKAAWPSISFAWLTQVPGGCTKEITFPTDVNAAGQKSMELRPYNYGRFYQRDLMLISRLRKIGMPFLDLRMLYSRTDAHIGMQHGKKKPDCLHMCIPGPLDVVASLFQRLLVELG